MAVLYVLQHGGTMCLSVKSLRTTALDTKVNRDVLEEEKSKDKQGKTVLTRMESTFASQQESDNTAKKIDTTKVSRHSKNRKRKSEEVKENDETSDNLEEETLVNISPKGADINSDHVFLIGKVGIRLKKIRGRQMTKKLNMEKLKNKEERRKFEANFQEKAATK
ncbi:hypothetical protein ANN_22506 [Periplaneta americana]|uniref:Uncharacterized protein n=1 Tax=Periplaneta americana TaxID=6978 RepID=A0ABQ8S8K5_PERAM|nr:hypothetical protein ANN_22506 [Periplaneta americana]